MSLRRELGVPPLSPALSGIPRGAKEATMPDKCLRRRASSDARCDMCISDTRRHSQPMLLFPANFGLFVFCLTSEEVNITQSYLIQLKTTRRARHGSLLSVARSPWQRTARCARERLEGEAGASGAPTLDSADLYLPKVVPILWFLSLIRSQKKIILLSTCFF